MRSGESRGPESVVREIRTVSEGLEGEDSVSTMCRREGISTGLYCRWSKDCLEAGKKRLVRDIQWDLPPENWIGFRGQVREITHKIALTT